MLEFGAARAKIATSWLWLAQRYPGVYEDVEAVVDLRASLNAKIEQQLVSTSSARRRRPDESRRSQKGAKGQRRKRREHRSGLDRSEAEQYRT